MRVFVTASVIALVVALSSDTFVNGRHGDFLGNNDVVIQWNSTTGKKWNLEKANCRPRKNGNGEEMHKDTSCDSECIDGAT